MNTNIENYIQEKRITEQTVNRFYGVVELSQEAKGSGVGAIRQPGGRMTTLLTPQTYQASEL